MQQSREMANLYRWLLELMQMIPQFQSLTDYCLFGWMTAIKTRIAFLKNSKSRTFRNSVILDWRLLNFMRT